MIRLPFIGYSKHELSIINMLYFLKTIFHIVLLFYCFVCQKLNKSTKI